MLYIRKVECSKKVYFCEVKNGKQIIKMNS